MQRLFELCRTKANGLCSGSKVYKPYTAHDLR